MDKKRAERATAWALLAAGALAAIAGIVFNLYDRFHWYDEVVHAYNFFALALLAAVYAYGVVLMGDRPQVGVPDRERVAVGVVDEQGCRRVPRALAQGLYLREGFRAVRVPEVDEGALHLVRLVAADAEVRPAPVGVQVPYVEPPRRRPPSRPRQGACGGPGGRCAG